MVGGFFVLRAGAMIWDKHVELIFLKVALTQVVFFFFYLYIFKPTMRKNFRRILGKGTRNCAFGFINAKGWIIMLSMIGLGFFLRSFSGHPIGNAAVTILYLGIGLALLLAGWKAFMLSFSMKFTGPVNFEMPESNGEEYQKLPRRARESAEEELGDSPQSAESREKQH